MKFRIIVFTALLTFLLIFSVGLAQDQPPTPADHGHGEAGHEDSAADESTCDVEAFVQQQQTYATALANFAEAYAEDPDSALHTVYYAGLTYQTFAESCGFVPPTEEHAEHEHSEDEHSDAAHLELALTIGDRANGEVLFNTLVPQTGFACATCHRVDSTETLIGPGLLNIADPGHDPSAHEHGSTDHAATEQSVTERTMDEVVAYIRTSIIHPSEYVVPGFPDLLMPQLYEEVLTEQQINDLVAYLLTLP